MANYAIYLVVLSQLQVVHRGGDQVARVFILKITAASSAINMQLLLQ